MNGRQKYNISKFVIIGDSLSDRGTVYNKKILGIHWERGVAGLGKSPDGSFTNGYTWPDHFLASIANKFIIQGSEQFKHLLTEDISDAIIDADKSVNDAVKDFYILTNDKSVKYRGRNFARTYTEGGTTSHNYSWAPSLNPVRFITRLILPSLEDKRKAVFAFDETNKVSDQDKSETIVQEWTGPNDLITVNKKPSKAEVDKSIAARMLNVEEFIKHGYKHFYLFNLPNLGLTPRYQNGSKEERDNASHWSNYYNEQLKVECENLRVKYSHLADFTLDIFDVNKQFVDMYTHPEKYGFEQDKLKIAYTDSQDFKINPNKTSPAKGYIFWDHEHICDEVHKRLADRLIEETVPNFNFVPPQRRPRQKQLRRTESTSDLHHLQTPSRTKTKLSPKHRREIVELGLFSKKIQDKMPKDKVTSHPAAKKR